MMDRELKRLAGQRMKILTELARFIKYVGPNHPNRAAENKRRSVHRKRLKRELKQNGLDICAEVMTLYHTEE